MNRKTPQFTFGLIALLMICPFLAPTYGQNQTTLLFSFIQVTDTQYANITQTSSVTQFILNNQTQYKIEYVVHTGDIAESQTNVTSWNIMNDSFSTLNGHVAFGWLAGNHDYDNKTDYTGNNYFAFNPANWNLTSSINEGRNTAQYLDIGGMHFLFVNIEFYASDNVRNWFKELYNRYSDATVILSTHSYLDPALGTYTNDTINPTALSDFPRVTLVLSGHRNFAYNQQIGNRQEIAFDRQYRADFHDESDYFRIYSVYSNGSVGVSTYSNLRDSFLNDPANTFTFTLFTPKPIVNPTTSNSTSNPTPPHSTTISSPSVSQSPVSSPTVPEIQPSLIITALSIALIVLTITKLEKNHNRPLKNRK
jgi:hypothetical protein